MRLIDADKLHYKNVLLNDGTKSAVVVFAREIDKAKKIEAVPIELYEQIKWERDTAIEQLNELGISLMEKPYLEAIPIEWIDTYCTDSDIGLRDNDPVVVKKLVEDWRKENEAN